MEDWMVKEAFRKIQEAMQYSASKSMIEKVDRIIDWCLKE